MTDFERFLSEKGEQARDVAHDLPTIHAWGNNQNNTNRPDTGNNRLNMIAYEDMKLN